MKKRSTKNKDKSRTPFYDIAPLIRKAVRRAKALPIFVKISGFSSLIILAIIIFIVSTPFIVASVSNINTVKFFPKDVSGDWQNADKISSIDLNSQALSSEFNSTNSAFTILPKIALPAQDDSSAPMPENSIPLLKEETAPIESTPTEELKSSTSPENEPVSSPEEEIAVPPAPEEKSVEIPAQNDQPPTTHPPTETPSQLPEPPPASPSQGGPASPPASTPGENQGGPASPPPTSQSLIEKPFSFLHRFLYGGLILALNDGESPVTDEKGKPDKEKAPVSQEKIAADQPPPQDESSTSPSDASENDKSPVSPSQPEQKTNPSKDEPASPSEDNSSPGKPDGNADQNEEKATNKEKEGVESQVTQPTETETESTEAPPPPEIILPTVGDEGALAQPTEPQEKISIFTSRKKLMLSGFKPEEERDAVSPIETIKLRLSMNITSKFNEDDELLVGYKVGENGIWSQLASFTQDQEYSNFKNGDYFSYELPIDTNLQDLSVEIFSLSNNDPDILGYEPPPIYIDAAWVEVDYIDEVAAPAVLEEVNQEEEYSVDYDETPQFEFYFKNDDRATLDRLISLAVRSRNFKITEVKLLHETGFEYEADADIQQEADGKWIVKIPNSDRKTIPGKYKVKITGVEDGQQYIEEQDFYWGVLAVNVNKSILLPGEDAYIQMAALTDKGVTICDANLKLDITVPDGTVVSPEVQRSGECKLDADIVDVPDYFVHYAANELGSYEMKLSRLDGDGAEIHHISSSFEVQDAVPFEVERTGPTRIFPLAKYKMKFTVKTNKDFTGNIIEHLPNSFAITENPEYAIQNGGSETRIFWNLDLKAGDVKQLSYEFDAPDTSPEFYLLGPLKIGEWNEARFWQIAADATATYDFVGCGATCDTSTDWWASQDDVDLFPFGGVQANRNTHLEATDAQYDLIDTSDNLRWTATDPGAGDQTLLWVEMKVDQTAASITQIDLTFEGLLANGDTTANGQMYVLKTGTAYETDANWVAVGATLSLTTTDTSFTRSITSNFTDYIGADGIITWALDNNASSTSIVTDYVKTVVTYTPSPTLTQNHYRWRDDTTALNTDGGYLAAEDTLYTPLRKNTPVRLRAEIANTGEAAATSYNYRLETALRTGGTCGDETFAQLRTSTVSWYNTLWQNRKAITITGQTGAGTNYQTLLKVGESSGATGEDFDLGGNSASFPSASGAGGDLVFTSSNGTTKLDFWVETVTGTTPNRLAYIWVEVAEDLGTNKNIYVYYKNSGASNDSNGVNTFQLFDDFGDGTIDTALWETSVGASASIAESGGTLSQLDAAVASSFSAIDTKTQQFNAGVALRTRHRRRDTGTFGNLQPSFTSSKGNNWGEVAISARNFENDVVAAFNGTLQTISSTMLTNNSWYRNEVRWISSTSTQGIYWNDNFTTFGTAQTVTGTPAQSNLYAHFRSADGVDNETDWIAVRKYQTTEPAFSSAAGEETSIWEMVTTTGYADGAAITASRLTATGTFVNGVAVEDPSNQTAAFSLTNGNYTEFEYAIQATNNAVDAGTYCFRLTNAGSTTNFVYSIYPQITLDVGGGRLFSSGFELQSVTSDVEWSTVSGTPAISTTTKRGGSASLEISSLVSATQKYADYEFKSANANGPFFVRTYLRVSTTPSAENRVISFRDSGGTDRAYITLDSGRLLRLYDEGGVIGSASSALTLDTWYRIELKIDATGAGATDTVEAKLDGTNIATSSTRNLTNGVVEIVVGGNLAGESQTTGVWYFDDVAVNENVGSSQNSYPGAGTIVHLRPNADGDAVAWTNTYTNMDEVTPNDATDSITSTTLDQIEEAGVEDPGDVGIRSSDTINVLHVGTRFRSSSTTNSTATVRIKSTSSGTLLESSGIATNSTTWFTNANAAPRTYPLSSYTKPEGGTWTPSNLSTTQIGAKLTVDGGVNTYQISTLWLLVEYAPATNGPTTGTQYDATHSTIIATGGTTTDGVTTNIYLDFHVISSFLTEIFTPKVEVRDVATSFTNAATATGNSFLYNPEVPRFRTWPAVDYDSANNRLIMFGGNDDTTTYLNDVWEMRLPTLANPQPVWRKMTPTGTAPSARNAMSHVYDSVNQRLIIFAGFNGANLGGFFSLTLPSSGDGAWSTFTPSGTLPSNRVSSAAIYDTANTRMIIFAGNDGVDKNDVWEITLPASLASSASLLLTPTGTAATTTTEHAMIYDSANQRMITFGGWGATRTNEVWSLTLPGTGQNGAWTQLSPTGTAPTGRSGHFGVYDSVNQRMVTGMGWDGTTFNSDIWELTLPASGSGVWTNKTSADGSLPPKTRSVGWAYDTVNKRAIVFGGTTSLFKLNLPLAVDISGTGTLYYQELAPMVNNTARDAAISVYDSVNQRMLTAFGFGRIYNTADPENTGYQINEVWGLSVADNTLRHISPYMSPGSRELPSVIYDTTNNRLVAFGGLNNAQDSTFNDTWTLSLSSTTNSTWTRLAPTGTLPAKRWGAATIYDSANQRMLIFGGKALGDASTHYKDVWELSLTAGSEAWTVRTPGTGGPTTNRWASTAIYDPVNTRMLIFGGRKEDPAVYYNELWELEFSTPGTETWTQRSPASPPAARRGHTSVYQGDFTEKKMIMFGGYDGTNHYNDVWKLNITTPGSETWTQVTPIGTAPLARRSHSAIYDPVNQRMIIQAGRGTLTPVNFMSDFFQLTLPSSTSSWTWSQILPDIYLRGSVAVTSLTAGTNYHWQAWITGTGSGDSTKASYGGNSDVITAATDFGITSPNITVSGNVYNYETTTKLTECDADSGTKELSLRASSTTYTASCSNVDGSFSFTNVTKPSAGAGMVVWIEALATDGALVIRYDGTGDSTGNVFYDDAVTVTSDDTSAVTNTNMDIYDNVNDTDIPYTVTGTALTVNNLTELHVTTGKTYTPGGTVTTDPSASASSTDGDLHIDGTGTLNMEANALSVGGDFNNVGTMTFTSGQTTTFTATATGHVITDGGENFENIIFNGASGGWSFADATTITKDLTLTAGTLSGTVDVTVNGAVACGVTCGTVTITGGTFLQSVGASAKNFGTSAASAVNWKFFNLTFTSNAAVVITTSSTGTGTIEVTNALTISASSTMNAGNRTYILSGAIAAPFVKTGTFQYSTGTMRFTGNSASVVVNALSGAAGDDGYYNLEIQPSGAVTYVLAAGTYLTNNNLVIGDGVVAGIVSGTTNDPTINVSGNLTINASGTLIAPDAVGNILSVKGNWLNSGTFTHSSQTVQFNGTATGKTINTGGTGAGKDFYNLTFNGAGGAWSPLTNTMTITNDLTMTAGTLDNTGGSADIVVNGAVAGTAGIINLTAGTFEQRIAANKNFGTTSGTTAWTFNNLTFSNSHASTTFTVTTQTGGTGGITVSGVFQFGKSGDTARTTIDAGNRTWTLSGAGGDPLQRFNASDDLAPSTSTFLYTGNNGAGNTTVQSETYNVLQVNNASEIYALEGTTAGATVTITAGTLDTGANALSATGDLTVTGTLQGTGNVTINGNVTGAGTVTMTGGTFEQIVAANKNFGSSSGTNLWTLSGLKFNNSDGVAARTITPNAGTGTIAVSGTLTLGDSGTQNITFDNETSNDRVFDIDGSITVSTKGVFSASSTASFTLATNLTNNGTFTANSGTVTVDGAGTSTFDGSGTPSITFFNLTSTTAGKTLSFTEAKTFRINGKLTISGASGNQIHIHSTSATAQWLVNHQGTEDVTYAHIEDSGCAVGTTNISLNNTSTNGDSNNGNCWLFPSLTFSLNTTSISLSLTAGNSWTTTATNTLTVTTTATSGYSLSAYETGVLTHTGYAGTTIADYTDGGTATYSAPTVWTATCGADTNKCGFGYNTNDADITQFAADKYAPFSQTAPGDEVAKSTTPQFTNDVTTITYRSSVSVTQKAGPYTTTIIYIVTPQF